MWPTATFSRTSIIGQRFLAADSVFSSSKKSLSIFPLVPYWISHQVLTLLVMLFRPSFVQNRNIIWGFPKVFKLTVLARKLFYEHSVPRFSKTLYIQRFLHWKKANCRAIIPPKYSKKSVPCRNLVSFLEFCEYKLRDEREKPAKLETQKFWRKK